MVMVDSLVRCWGWKGGRRWWDDGGMMMWLVVW